MIAVGKVTGEDRIVDKIRGLATNSPGLTIGPGDDAAVVDRAAGLLAATTDMLVEGVDFLPGEDPERLGRRAVAVNLSDLAAMGAEPEFFLLSIAVPADRGEEVPLGIVRGAIARAAAHGAALAGGDLSAAPLLVVSIAFWGRPAGDPLTRSGASPGDLVYVTGHPGDAAAGLRLAAAVSPDLLDLAAADRQSLLAAFRDPEPRVAFGAWLGRERLATAAIDVSDGLGLDAGRLARASGVRLSLERERLPVSPALAAFGAASGVDPIELAIAGGDDYELLFTVREADAPRLADKADALDVPIRAIGRVSSGSGAVLSDSRNERDIASLGHDHFRASR
ncbi:MAG: thiamine-phosphate kinase [Thermoanaerobaculia bacterium]